MPATLFPSPGTLVRVSVLFLTPLSFLMSTARNARTLVDRVALVLGLVISPLLTWWGIGLDLLWTGIVGGTVAYGVYRLRGARYAPAAGGRTLSLFATYWHFLGLLWVYVLFLIFVF